MNNLMQFLFFIITLFLLSIYSCKIKTETIFDEINLLIKNEKYETALLTIRKKLESQRVSDEVLSSYQQSSRILELSNDRNRVIWIEDKKLIYRDLANPTIKTREFTTAPVSLSISYDAMFAILGFTDKEDMCYLKAISIMETKPDYTITKPVKCIDRPAISHNGEDIYFFKQNNLYKSNILQFNKSIKILKKEDIESPFPKISNKNLLFPIDKTFILFSGNAGSYNMYWFNPVDNYIEKLADDIMIPYLFYGNSSNGYVIIGSVGSQGIRKIQFNGYEFPKVTESFPIEEDQMNPWETINNEEFFSGKNGTVFTWGPNHSKKLYPILCKQFWGVARNHIIYESNNGELILSNMSFTPAEWKYLDIYLDIKERKSSF